MISITDLSFGYGRKSKLFDGLQLSLPPGNIYGLLGRNGAGKSTLLKIISGLLFPEGGDVSVFGFNPKARNPEFLREVFLIPEEFDLPPMHMNDYICLYGGFYPRFDKIFFQNCIHELGIPQGDKLSSMSYGQKKNFLLSFGLATDSKLLLMDEPTNGLDIPSKSLFRKMVANAIHEDRCFIISTHQVRDMENLIDPIIILDGGEIILRQNFEQICRKLSVSRYPELPDNPDVLYYESSLNGYTVVEKNRDQKESRINLELLFNTVVASKSKISALFKN